MIEQLPLSSRIVAKKDSNMTTINEEESRVFRTKTNDIVRLRADLEANFSMQKLRVLEERAATII